MSKEKKICCICGRDCTNEWYSKNMCLKHYYQFKKYGKCLDNNQRTIWDPNEVRVYTDYAEVDTYDNVGNVKETYLLDIEDISLLQGHKWRTTYKGKNVDMPYLVTGHAGKQGKENNETQIYFHRLVMNTKEEIDHLNRNTLDNRKSNLRKSYRTQQLVNTSIRSNNTSGMKGVYYAKEQLYRPAGYKAEMQIANKRIATKNFNLQEKAIYARIVLEMLFMDEHGLFNVRDYMIERLSKYDISTYDDVKQYLSNKFNDQNLSAIYEKIDKLINEYKVIQK